MSGFNVHLWRQCTVLIGSCMLSVGTGLMLSFPSVLNPDILSPNGTIHTTPDQASWIAGISGISGFAGFCIIPFIMKIYGRIPVNIVLNLLAAVGFLIFFLANNVSCLYAARIIQGFKMSAVYVSILVLAEYSHPKRRGYFISIKKTMVPIGSLICHSLGMCWTWKQIAAFAMIPHVLAIIITCTWLESPSFLALAGKYDKCRRSHRWIFGDSTEMERELDDLISTQIEARKHTRNKENLRDIIIKLLKKDFLKPLTIASLLTVIIDASGRYYMLAYVVQILIEVTKDKSISVYCTIGSDLLTIAALLISTFVMRCFKRRTILFFCGIFCVFLMCLTSLMILLKSHYNVGESIWWFTPLIILLNVFNVNVGLVPVSFTIICEIIPLEHKATGLCILGMVFTILFFLVMKFTPLMMENTGVEGTFGIYAFFVAIALLILYFILNETKDKTLQEIERHIKGIKQFNINENNYLNKKPLIES